MIRTAAMDNRKWQNGRQQRLSPFPVVVDAIARGHFFELADLAMVDNS